VTINKEKLLILFMLVTGVMTTLVGLGLLAPGQVQQAMFGAPSDNPLALLLTPRLVGSCWVDGHSVDHWRAQTSAAHFLSQCLRRQQGNVYWA
jgi:hypothetical protein